MLDESRDGVAKKIFGEHFCLVRERFAGKLIPCRSLSSRARPLLRATTGWSRTIRWRSTRGFRRPKSQGGKIGEWKNTSYYLLYTPNGKEDRALDMNFLKSLKDRNRAKVIYCE